MVGAEERETSVSRDKELESPASSSDRVRLEVSILSSASEDGASDAEEEVSEPRADWRTVLVVAAESDMRIYVRRCLRRHGEIRVVEAADGAGAVRAGRRTHLDVVIVDVDGPGPAATTLVGALRSQEAFARVPLILISDDEVDDTGLRRVADPALSTILVKPFNARQLCGEVERMLELAPSANESREQGEGGSKP